MGTIAKILLSLHEDQQNDIPPILNTKVNAVSTGMVQPNDDNVLHTGETKTSVQNDTCGFDDIFDEHLLDNLLNSDRIHDLNSNNSYDFDNEQDFPLFSAEQTMKLRNNKMTEEEQTKKISRNMIPRNSLVIYHTPRDKFDSTRVKKTTIEKEIVEMDLFKRSVKGHARIQIKRIMAVSAKHINLLRSDGESVETFLEVCAVWKEWNGMNNTDIPNKMFYIMYGWFDENPNWIKEMETQYMAINGLQYKTEQTTRRLNTIGMLISIMKNDCVKLINKRSISTHNMKITITRRDGHGTKSDHKKRRKKGKFQDSFLSCHNTLKIKHEINTVVKNESDNIHKNKLHHNEVEEKKDTDNNNTLNKNIAEKNVTENHNNLKQKMIINTNKSDDVLENELEFVEEIKKNDKEDNNSKTDIENEMIDDLKSAECQKKEPSRINKIEKNHFETEERNSKSFSDLKANYEARIGKLQSKYDKEIINDCSVKKNKQQKKTIAIKQTSKAARKTTKKINQVQTNKDKNKETTGPLVNEILEKNEKENKNNKRKKKILVVNGKVKRKSKTK